MTTVDTHNGIRRDGWRREIAELLDVDPATLPDRARLADDLGLDSLAMMTLLGWLGGKGVSTADRAGLHRVGDVFTMLERLPAQNGVTLRVAATSDRRGGVHDLPPVEPRRSALAPVLRNSAYRLAPIQDGDLAFLYTLAVHPETGYRWRYRGQPPPPERFAAELWGQVLVQYVAREVNGDEPVGLVVAYAADLAQGHAFVGAVFVPEHAGTGLAAEATAMFVRYLFHAFPLRKLYLEVPGFNWPQVQSGAGRLFHVEGVLKGHDFYAGRYWDKYLCAVYRPDGPHEDEGRTR
jgi:RimJ/RimL family protein N-acetyltransferase/aryl carrier-like protein